MKTYLDRWLETLILDLRCFSLFMNMHTRKKAGILIYAHKQKPKKLKAQEIKMAEILIRTLTEHVI